MGGRHGRRELRRSVLCSFIDTWLDNVYLYAFKNNEAGKEAEFTWEPDLEEEVL